MTSAYDILFKFFNHLSAPCMRQNGDMTIKILSLLKSLSPFNLTVVFIYSTCHVFNYTHVNLIWIWVAWNDNLFNLLAYFNYDIDIRNKAAVVYWTLHSNCQYGYKILRIMLKTWSYQLFDIHKVIITS